MKAMKVRTPYKNKKGRVFSWLALMFGFGIGLTFPIIPGFIKTFAGTDGNVSFFFSALALVVFLSSIVSSFLFRKISRTKIFKLSLLICALTFAALPLAGSIWSLFGIEFIHMWFRVIVWIALSLFVYDYTKKKYLGKAEGTYYVFNNIGFFIGPLLGGYMGKLWGYEAVFYAAAAVIFITMIFFIHQHIVSEHTELKAQSEKPYTTKFSQDMKDSVLQFFKNKERRKAYIVSLGLSMWFGFKFTYIPLYILYKGFQSDISGFILAMGILPLLFLEKFAGSYADKHGCKKPIAFGFLFYAFILFLAYSIDSLLAAVILLIIANIGTAMIEPLKDVYILKNIKKGDEERFFGVFKTSHPVGEIIAPLIGAAVFVFGSYELLFLTFAIINLLFAAVLIERQHA